MEDNIVAPSECSAIYVGSLMDFSEISQWLPPGFYAADVSEQIPFVAAPLEVNAGLALAFTTQCQGPEPYSYTGFWISIEPPFANGALLEGMHWYEVRGFYDESPFYPELDHIEPLAFTFQNQLHQNKAEANGGALLRLQAHGSIPTETTDTALFLWHQANDAVYLLSGTMKGLMQTSHVICESNDAWVHEFMDCHTHNEIGGQFASVQFQAELDRAYQPAQ